MNAKNECEIFKVVYKTVCSGAKAAQDDVVAIISVFIAQKKGTKLDVVKRLTRFFQRFNVAITRAQALLIVIGNPEMLTKDDNWRKQVYPNPSAQLLFNFFINNINTTEVVEL